MRICHIIGSLDPAGGGPPQVAVRIASAQALAGHEVRLVSYASTDAKDQINQSLSSVPHLDRVERVYMDPPTGRLHRLTAGHVRTELQNIISHSEVLHMHGVWETLLRVSASIARQSHCPYVIRPVGMLDPWSMSQKSWKKKLAMAIAYKRMLNNAHFIHALNDDEAELIVPLGLKCPVPVIPNGVFLEEIEPLPAPGTFRAQHPELGDHPFVLFMARLHYKKGLDYLADSFKYVVDAGLPTHLVVAGPDEGARAKFEQQVAQLGLTDRVHVVGPIYGADKYAAMTDTACFCLPSRQEGFSVAITEALACGAPCVISEPCHFPEVGRAGAGRVVPLDAGAVGRALAEVLADAELRQRMSKAGRALIREHYTWERIAGHLVKLYEDPTSNRVM